jgi:hypothetical protein
MRGEQHAFVDKPYRHAFLRLRYGRLESLRYEAAVHGKNALNKSSRIATPEPYKDKIRVRRSLTLPRFMEASTFF